MIKSRRQKMIKEIVEQNNIETQFQLTEELSKYGCNVTQATVSRDIKEMGLIKVATADNTFCYYYPPTGMITDNALERAKKMLRDNVLSVDVNSFIIMMRTLPGTAQGIAFCLDRLNWKEIMGSLAGDDTIIILAKEGEDSHALADRIKELAQ